MISFRRFFKIQSKMQAFNLKTLQTVAVFLTWARECKISESELVDYLKLVPVFERLNRIGYFNPMPDIEQSRMIVKVEKSFPKNMRLQLRKARLEYSMEGKIPD